MKPAASASRLALPVALGLGGLPLILDAPVWGAATMVGAALLAFSGWRQQLDDRPPVPDLQGEAFAPLDVSIAWRTDAGRFPVARRGWQLVVTEDDVWILPVAKGAGLMRDRDYVRIPRLDLLKAWSVSSSDLRLQFVDEHGRTQEARLGRVAHCVKLLDALGFLEEAPGHLADLGFPD